MFKKIGENTNILRVETNSIPISNEILDSFKKTAGELKKVAPKADDFLYFSAVMMHAAEASSINDDGTPKLNSKGEVVSVGWDESNGTMKWMSNDPSIKPYKNANADIFPEKELIKAYKKWREKPLCIDHKSSSVDHIRGIIVDTYYDYALKRVIALCALDKKNYPELAKKVSSGVSNCVSMGTAVGKAICTDCATVARVESEFCDHMRRKSGYGEINTDLNPIELSIVVNGADPKAKIKQIVAAANALNSYVETKQSEFNKFAKEFQAKLTFDNGTSSDIEVKSKDIASFQDDINEAIEDFKALQSSMSEEEKEFSEKDSEDSGNDSASNHNSLNKEDILDYSEEEDSLRLSPPYERFADFNSTLKKVASNIEVKLDEMQRNLDKLMNKKEEYMSGNEKDFSKKAYYQGTEEPTPGQPKYEVDPLNEKLRTDGDKHMKGDSPFPGVGPVDSLYPGDLERKKLLARAEAEERAIRRTAIVNAAREKLGYYQNGEGANNPNTPTPGKVKYPADKMNEVAREKDKHMNGKKPFPGVGPVDEMYPEDKKRKELLNRAESLSAKFVKTKNADGSSNLGKSAWQVIQGDKIVLTASVDELTNGQSAMLYKTIATKEFGADLITKVRALGSDGVKSLLKQAQAEAPPAAPEMPEAASVQEAEAEDTGKTGDPKETALKLSEKVRDLSSDLVEAVRSLTGEQVEMGEEAEMGAPVTASFKVKSLLSMRKEINAGLTQAMKEAVAELNEHQEELDMIKDLDLNRSNTSAVASLVEDSFNDAKTAIADGFQLMTAFVKYARGTNSLVKQAQTEAELEKLTQEEGSMDSSDSDDLMALLSDSHEDLGEVKSLMSDDELESPADHEVEEAHEGSMSEEFDEANAEITAKSDELKQLGDLPPNSTVHVTAGFNSKASRAAMRAKLAADTVKFSPMLDQAHPKGGFQTELDVKPTGDLGKVEDLKEVHDAMMDLANATPKVKKEAAVIQNLISQGKLRASDLEDLVAEGLDKDAVAYWKKFYGEVDGGSEFASELVKEHVKAELEEQLNTYKVKLGRAYELTYDMIDRGLCANHKLAIADQVEDIMNIDDKGFDSFKKVVASSPLRKEASRMPRVGFLESEAKAASIEDEYAQLSDMFGRDSKHIKF